MSDIPTPHINAAFGDFAETVLMPGDPLRSKFIADNFLENAVLVNNVRGVQGYTGIYKGKRVSVMASGMGQPSIAIYSYELFSFYGVKNIIRVGSAGGIAEDVELRDVIIADKAVTLSNIGEQMDFPAGFEPNADKTLVSVAEDVCMEFGYNYKKGAIYTSDAFYGEVSALPFMKSKEVLAVEMETVALYLNAVRTGKRALTICTISDIAGKGSLSAEERQTSFKEMMTAALETAIRL